jgi:hypothetical protein
LRAQGREPRGAAERPTVSGRAAGRRGKKQGKGRRGEEDADVRAPVGRGRRRERGGGARAGELGWRGPRGGKEREECWASGSAWAREKERGEGRGELGRAKGFGATFFLSSFPFLHSNHSNNSI